MSDFRPSAIRNAIRDVLEGTDTRGFRKMVPDVFKYGAFDGNNDRSNHALTLDIRYQHRFDVVLGPLRQNGSSPMSNKGPARHSTIDITVEIWTRLGSTVNVEERDLQRERVEQNAELAIQALAYPGNLTTSLDGLPTGIVSGLLSGRDNNATPTWEVVTEDWTKQIHRSRISAAAIVVVGQFTGG